MLKRMLSRYAVAICSLATFVCLQAPAQSTSPASSAPQPAAQTAPPAASTQSNAQTQPANPSASQQAPLRLQDLPPDPHTPTPAEQAEQRQQRMLAAASQLASAQARWGPEISTPGISIALVEMGRTKAPSGATQISYQVKGSGFSPGEAVNLVRWPLDSSAKTVMSGITFDPQGNAICTGTSATPTPAPAAPGSPAPAAGSPAAQAVTAPSCTTSMQPKERLHLDATVAAGEVVRVALVDEAKKRGAATSAVPFPIANEDKGCRLQVLLGVRNADLVLVEGTGFPANTGVKLESTTAGQARDINTKTNADGHLVVAVLPAQKDLETGDTTVRFAGVVHAPTLNNSTTPAPADPACAPSVTFHWGKDSYKQE